MENITVDGGSESVSRFPFWDIGVDNLPLKNNTAVITNLQQKKHCPEKEIKELVALFYKFPIKSSYTLTFKTWITTMIVKTGCVV